MKNILLVLAAGMAFSASAAFAGAGADVGVLTCKLKDVKNDIVYSKEEFACEFKLSSGDVQKYTGQDQKHRRQLVGDKGSDAGLGRRQSHRQSRGGRCAQG